MKDFLRNLPVLCITAALALLPAMLTGCAKENTNTSTAKGATQFPAGRPPTPEELQRALEQQKKLRPAGAPGGSGNPAPQPGATTPAR